MIEKMGKYITKTSRMSSKKLRVITLLNLGNVTVHPFTNNLAAYEYLVGQIPKGLTYQIPSYSTVNRTVKNAGDSFDLHTPVGLYTIKKAVLFMKGC